MQIYIRKRTLYYVLTYGYLASLLSAIKSFHFLMSTTIYGADTRLMKEN